MPLAFLLITLPALALAGASTVIAWRLSRDNHRRSTARVAALAAELRDLAPVTSPAEELLPNTARPLEMSRAPLFSTDEPMEHSRRSLTIALAGVLVVSLVASLATFSFRHAQAAGPVSVADPTPLELKALHSERQHEALVIRGSVRNPDAAAPLADVSAVVLLFDESGTLVAQARASVDSGELLPGHEQPFTFRVADAPAAQKYRVSFRTGTRTVPHVDQRHGS